MLYNIKNENGESSFLNLQNILVNPPKQIDLINVKHLIEIESCLTRIIKDFWRSEEYPHEISFCFEDFRNLSTRLHKHSSSNAYVSQMSAFLEQHPILKKVSKLGLPRGVIMLSNKSGSYEMLFECNIDLNGFVVNQN
jgi:hypothetical protein